MSSVSVTNSFSNNTVADASQVNTNFTDLTTFINNRNAGTATWDLVSISTASGTPLAVDNSTGGQVIAVFKANGVTKMSVNLDGRLLAENNIGLAAKNTSGTVGNLIIRDSSDNLIVGESTFNNPVLIKTGTSYISFTIQASSEAMRIDSSGRVGIGTASPNSNSILDLTSTTKAFMPPRMTGTQRDAIPSPTAGMVIYNTSTNKLNVYTTGWEAVTSA